MHVITIFPGRNLLDKNASESVPTPSPLQPETFCSNNIYPSETLFSYYLTDFFLKLLITVWKHKWCKLSYFVSFTMYIQF